MNENAAPVKRSNCDLIQTYRDRVSKELQASGISLQNEFEKLLSSVLPTLDLYCGARLMILNSGHGEISELISHIETSVSILNADISEEMLRYAKVQQPGISQVRIREYSQLPFEPEQFDRLLSLFLFGEQLSDLPSLAKEMSRISIPDSKWVLIYPCRKKRVGFLQTISSGKTSLITCEQVKTLLIDSGWKSIEAKQLMAVSLPATMKTTTEQITLSDQKNLVLAAHYELYLFACKK